MATVNYAAREINVKIVYYGPALSGKTTNLQIIHKKSPDSAKSDMVSLATEADRTLFFDFLPIDLGKIKGFTTKIQLYTVPGQVYYNATRKLVLRGVDGIVFVADSQPEKMAENIESLENMEANLAEYGYDLSTIPVILQYNKRDLPNAMDVNQLNQQLNRYNTQFSTATARSGEGVFETLKLIGKRVIDILNHKYSSPQQTMGMPQQQAAPQQQTAPQRQAMPQQTTQQAMPQQQAAPQQQVAPPQTQQQAAPPQTQQQLAMQQQHLELQRQIAQQQAMLEEQRKQLEQQQQMFAQHQQAMIQQQAAPQQQTAPQQQAMGQPMQFQQPQQQFSAPQQQFTAPTTTPVNEQSPFMSGSDNTMQDPFLDTKATQKIPAVDSASIQEPAMDSSFSSSFEIDTIDSINAPAETAPTQIETPASQPSDAFELESFIDDSPANSVESVESPSLELDDFGENSAPSEVSTPEPDLNDAFLSNEPEEVSPINQKAVPQTEEPQDDAEEPLDLSALSNDAPAEKTAPAQDSQLFFSSVSSDPKKSKKKPVNPKFKKKFLDNFRKRS